MNPISAIGKAHSRNSSKRLIMLRMVHAKHCLSDTNYATGKIGTKLDLVLFHAKGQPRVINGNVTMNVGTQMRNIRGHFRAINEFPELKEIPIVIGESDPEGCAACGMATNPENAYRNGTLYSSYTAASFARKYLLADHFKVNFMGAVLWLSRPCN